MPKRGTLLTLGLIAVFLLMTVGASAAESTKLDDFNKWVEEQYIEYIEPLPFPTFTGPKAVPGKKVAITSWMTGSPLSVAFEMAAHEGCE